MDASGLKEFIFTHVRGPTGLALPKHIWTWRSATYCPLKDDTYDLIIEVTRNGLQHGNASYCCVLDTCCKSTAAALFVPGLCCLQLDRSGRFRYP